jgi:hypothetical protein
LSRISYVDEISSGDGLVGHAGFFLDRDVDDDFFLAGG